MELQLKDFSPGEKGLVSGYNKASPAYRDRLLSMGLTKGTEFIVKRVAPLGDPIEIQLRGFNLSLRKEESKVLVVKKIEEN